MASSNENVVGGKFTLDITELKASITEANRQIKLANSEFKNATAGMDNWSSSADGLSAKIKQLNSVVDSEEAKLQSLQQQYELVAQEQGENSKAAQELLIKINNQSAAVKTAQAQLGKYEDALNDIESGASAAGDAIEDAGDSAREAGDDAEKSSEGWTIVKDVIADMAKDAIAWAVESFKELMTASDTALSSLQAKVGATTEKMEDYKSVMDNLYRNNYGESYDDISESMSKIINVMGDMDDGTLEKMTSNALTLRDAYDMDVKESVRAVNSLMKQFGISGEEAYNLVVQGAQNGLNQNEDLLDTINEYSVQFKNAGYSADDMLNMLANGTAAGTWSVDKLGDAVKEFNIRMSDGTVTEAMAENSKALGLTSTDVTKLTKQFNAGGTEAQAAIGTIIDSIMSVDDETKRYQLGVSMFGTMWEDLGENTVSSLFTIEGGINSAKNAMEELDEIKYDNLEDSTAGLGRMIQSDLLQPLSDIASEALKTGIDWIIENFETLKPIIVGVGAALTTLATALAIQGLIKGVAAAVAFLNTTLLANPVMLVVTAITALVAALIYLWNTNEGFRNFMTTAWEGIKTTVVSAAEGIVNFFTVTIPEAFNNFIIGVQNFTASVGQFFSDGWNAIVTFFTEGIPNFISSVLQWLGELPYNIGLIIGTILGNIIKFGVDAYNWITTEVPKFIATIVSFMIELPFKIWDAIIGSVQKVTEWLGKLISVAKTETPKFTNNIITFMSELPGKIWNAIVGAVQKVKEWFGNLISTAKTEVPKFVSGIIEKAKELPGDFLDIGSDIVKGLWEGIKNMGTWIKDKVTSFFSGITDGVKGVLGISSPSKVFKGLGEFTAEGFGIGFEDSFKHIKSGITDLMDFDTTDFNVNTSNNAGSVGSAANNSKNVIINQYNNSPKSLSQLEIYKQTKSAARLAVNLI